MKVVMFCELCQSHIFTSEVKQCDICKKNRCGKHREYECCKTTSEVSDKLAKLFGSITVEEAVS